MDEKPWRYRAGRPGYNLVTVYERYVGGPIWVETWPHGKRKRQPLQKVYGNAPVLDKKLAARVADALSREIEHATVKDQNAVLLGIPEPHTLGELLAAYHAKHKDRWRPGHARHQDIMRDFWLKRLGPKLDVRSMSKMASDIEGIARAEAKRRSWSPRTEGKYLKYIKAASRFGRLKLKWYGEDHDLSAVDVPTPDSQAESYSTDEIIELLPALEAVDLRAAAIGHVAYSSLRRVVAIASLPSRVTFQTMVVDREIVRVCVLSFGRAKDKVKRSAQVAVSGRGLELIERLLETPAVKASGLLFPAGDLNDASKDRQPVSYEHLNDWLRAAEVIAGVPHIKGRAWHAFKRRATTDAEKVMGNLSAASKQAGTDAGTLARVYAQHDIQEKAALAIALARRVATAS